MKKLLFPVAILLSMASCLKSGSEEPASAPAPPDYSSILIPASQVPLFAKLSDYNIIPPEPETKAEETMVALESLLDYDNVCERMFEGKTFQQIPFRQDYEHRLASFANEPTPDIASATVIKKFLITVTKSDTANEYVATMITGHDYAKYYPDFDYLHKSNYTGVILFSTLEGKLAEVRRYAGGRAIECRILRPDEIQNTNAQTLHFINLYASTSFTKAQEVDEYDGGELAASVCITDKPKPNPLWNECDWGRWQDPPNEGDSVGGGGGSNGSNGSGSASGDADGGDDNQLIQLDKTEYTVNLSSNVPEYVSMQGSGTYEEGSTIAIGYYLNQLVTQIEFSMWTGDFHNRKTPTFTHKVTKNIVSTAYFDYMAPCADDNKNVTNPLINMEVAPSGGWNYLGGTFGKTRNAGKRNHQGIDFAAPCGTPVYAMYSGVIHYTYTKAPNKNVENSFGNVLVIECLVDGEKLYFQYAHLQYNDPIAINPRTWDTFHKGDAVFAGDLIGYSGKTGNAYNVSAPHLHLGVSTTWDTGRNWINPAPYINGTIDTDSIMTNKGNVDNIKCD